MFCFKSSMFVLPFYNKRMYVCMYIQCAMLIECCLYINTLTLHNNYNILIAFRLYFHSDGRGGYVMKPYIGLGASPGISEGSVCWSCVLAAQPCVVWMYVGAEEIREIAEAVISAILAACQDFDRCRDFATLPWISAICPRISDYTHWLIYTRLHIYLSHCYSIAWVRL